MLVHLVGRLSSDIISWYVFTANSSLSNKNERTALQEAEIGHYHYCLLVFAAFEQMKDKKETRAPLDTSDVQKKKKDRRYER